MTEWPTERDGSLPYFETVYDSDMGAIAQVTHPDGTVATAADVMMGAALWGSASVIIAADGSLHDLQAPAVDQTKTDNRPEGQQ